MKRNILFGFLLIGLVVMEWGCCGEGTTEFSWLEGARVWVTGEQADSTKYTELTFAVDGDYTIELIDISNTSLYACSNDYVKMTTVDSMELFCSKPYRGAQDPREYFSYDGISIQGRINLGQSSYQRRMVLSEPPLKTDTFSFTFNLIDTEGNMFETTTEPIIITP